MLKNYFLIALRTFWRNKVFTLISMTGLAIGIGASLVIYLIVHHELSYENFHRDKDRIYRVVSNMHFPNQDFKNSGVPGPLPDAARQDIPQIETSSAFVTAGGMKVSIPESGSSSDFPSQDDIVFADSLYFDLFDYEWIAGSGETALLRPNQVVLSKSRAEMYFETTDISKAIGKTLVYNDTIQTIVTGIIQDLNEVTDFQFKEFISLPTYRTQLNKQNEYDSWGSISSSSQFFAKLKEGVSPDRVNDELSQMRRRHITEEHLPTDHYLQPIKDIHFNPDFGSFGPSKGHKPTLYGLLAVAAFLLSLGCINYINLTTAQASNRAKEIGIRKTLGGTRRQLMGQFLSESILITGLACILSIVLIPVILNIFSDFVPEGLNTRFIEQPYFIGFILLLFITVSLLSGFYPSIVLSGYQPAAMIKNQGYFNNGKSRKVWLRKGLTLFQFVIAQFFIIATLVVVKQIGYVLNKDMGFKQDAIIYFHTPWRESPGKRLVLLEKLRSIPEISQISFAGDPPASGNTSSTTMKFNKEGEVLETTVEVKYADTSYFDLYNMELVAGKWLHQSDTIREYVINESLARFLGFTKPEEAIGKFLEKSNRQIPIVGVLKDFHTKSMHEAIKPLAYSCQINDHRAFHISLPENMENNTSAWKSTISKIENEYQSIYPDLDFRYYFFDEEIAKFYEKEQNTARLMNWCSGLAIFISCLGLLGLVIFTTSERTKEIGIRKILGASVPQIILLLSREFLTLVLLAFIIATPLAWWAMNEWLNDFAYRTAISWWVFALGGLILLAIALLTLSVRTVRAATANPVEALRAE